MAFTPFSYDMEIIAKLSDTPNVDDGFTAYQLKEKFDEGGRAVKDFINNTLLPEIEEKEQETAEAVAAAQTTADNAQTTADNAQAAADAITPDSIGAEKARLQFTNISVSSFSSNATYADFPYRASVALEGVTEDMVPEVVFGVADAMSGIFAPVAESYDGGVYIYSSEVPTAAINIPVIILWR
jgi:hypothetical protein